MLRQGNARLMLKFGKADAGARLILSQNKANVESGLRAG